MPVRRPLRCFPATAGLALVLAVAGCSSTSTKGIRLGSVRTATVTEVVDAPAAVTARATATVTSPADGQVSALYVTDGQRVVAGTVLGIIASTSAQQRLVQARQAAAAAAGGSVRVPGADLSGLQAQTDAAAALAFGQARSALAQIPDPVARATAARQLATGEAQYAAARAQAQAAVRQFNAGLAGLGAALRSLTAAQQAQAQAGVALAQAAVDALTLRAPIAGTVQLGGVSAAAGGSLSDLLGQLPQGGSGLAGGALPGGSGAGGAGAGGTSAPTVIAAGTPVSAGTAVVTILDVSSLGLQAAVDETDVLLVRPGQRARVELDAVPGATFQAIVAAVDLSPTTSSQGGVSYHVRLRLGAGRSASGGVLSPPRPGMSAVVHLAVRVAPNALAVPAAAVVRAGRRDVVWLVRGGTAQRRYVTVGTQGPDMVALTEGVRAGDRIVVAGADRVHAGQHLP